MAFDFLGGRKVQLQKYADQISSYLTEQKLVVDNFLSDEYFLRYLSLPSTDTTISSHDQKFIKELRNQLGSIYPIVFSEWFSNALD